MTDTQLTQELELFKQLLERNRYDFVKLAFIIFPYGQPGHELEHKWPFDWQLREWDLMSKHFSNPETRDKTYKIAISTGNGSGKTAWAAQTNIMLLYAHKLKGRLTGNTKPQITQIIWPEYDKWFRYARYSNLFFEKFGESIQSLDAEVGKQWRLDQFTWDATNPTAVSGLHNEGHAVAYTFEEAPGIPADIFKYANGAFTDRNTIKLWMALGNSDDPDSRFEQLMSDPGWRGVRIDTRTLPHVSRDFIETLLRECGGDEDADDFRIRVRGLPRKTNADAIISRDKVSEALDRGPDFDISAVSRLPVIITVDPAWTGGDLTTIWVHQGNWSKLLAAYALDKARGDDHRITYDKVVAFEKRYGADAVWIDQGEGTTLKTLANADQRYNWELVSFAQQPTDTPQVRDSEFANMRAQLYYQTAKYFRDEEPVVEIADDIEPMNPNETVRETFVKQMGYTKGDRHKITMKKLCESKKEIKARVGHSPDLADGFVLRMYRVLLDRLPDNDTQGYAGNEFYGERAREMFGKTDRTIERPSSVPDYSMGGYNELYRQKNYR